MLRSVAVIAQEPVSFFELGVLVEVFGIDRSEEGVPLFDFRICGGPAPRPGGRAELGSPTTTSAPAAPTTTTSAPATHTPTTHSTGTAIQGVRLDGLRPLSEAANADLVAVPSSSLTHAPDPAVLEALHTAYEHGAYVLSLCSGTFALAWAGLLDGRRAATHWRYARQLQALFPPVRVDEDVLYAVDGRIVTGAGTAAGIDACLHLVRMEHGSEVASKIARRMVVAPHRGGGQKQFIERPLPESGSSLQGLLEHLAGTVEHPHTIASMAREASMSERTLARQFLAQTGSPPHAWLTAQRVLAARRLLESTDLSLDQVSTRVGLGSADLLRHHFVRALGLNPTAYRRAFAAR